ncbi:MAG: M48 family metallopeptidase, partial [Lachnospiraceae bacterium]|nr:M48 family metallopeptidase [Lachnospiraceae bacterium]
MSTTKQAATVVNMYRDTDTEKDTIYLDTRIGMIPCRIIRSRRKTYGVVVNAEGEVQMRIPLKGSRKKAVEMAEKWRDWIVKKVLLQQKRAMENRALSEESQKRFSPQQRKNIEKQCREAAREYSQKKAAYYANILGVSFERVRIAGQKTLWGSCSGKGTLSFNWKLMLAPTEVFDYVIAHEVCHLKEMNHL